MYYVKEKSENPNMDKVFDVDGNLEDKDNSKGELVKNINVEFRVGSNNWFLFYFFSCID